MKEVKKAVQKQILTMETTSGKVQPRNLYQLEFDALLNNHDDQDDEDEDDDDDDDDDVSDSKLPSIA